METKERQLPKYSIGDTVWYVKGHTIESEEVTGVQLTRDSEWEYSVSQIYISSSAWGYGYPSIEHLTYLEEKHLFPSKESLLNHLKDN